MYEQNTYIEKSMTEIHMIWAWNKIALIYAILMRTKKFETRLQLNSYFENYDIGLENLFEN